MEKISPTIFFKKSWETVKANFFKIVGATAILFVIQVGLDSFSTGDEKNGMTPEMGIMSLVATIISLVISVAVTSATIKIVRGAPVAMNVFSITPQQVLRYVGVIVTLALILLAFVIPLTVLAVSLGVASFVPSLTLDASIISFLVILAIALIFLIYIQVRLMFATYLVIDGKAAIFESIKKSWSMTQGKVWSLVLFGMMALIIALLGILALLVGLLIAIPVITFASGYLYVSFIDNHGKEAVAIKE
jgi:membrane-anchored glycerophosphoryl diester phosphodiesterase (GDPDase)